VLFEVDNPAGKLNHGAAEVRDLEDAVKRKAAGKAESKEIGTGLAIVRYPERDLSD
jgi:hypothetical protein